MDVAPNTKGQSMARIGQKSEAIVAKLRQVDVLQSQGTSAANALRHICGEASVGPRPLRRSVFVGVKDMTGAVTAPFNALLVLRGLKTLAVRAERRSRSAHRVATWLADHPEINAVFYPGSPTYAQLDLARRQMTLPGGMIAFELAGGLEAGRRLMNRLRMIQRAVSLGDAETLIQYPASMTHSTYTPEERAHHDIGDGLIRLAIGLEDVDDIINDLDQGLAPLRLDMTA